MKDLPYLWVVLVLVKARITWRRKVVPQTVLKKNRVKITKLRPLKEKLNEGYTMAQNGLFSYHLESLVCCSVSLWTCELTTASLRDFWPYSAIPPQWPIPSRSSLVESTLLVFKVWATKLALQSWRKHTLETSPKFFLRVLFVLWLTYISPWAAVLYYILPSKWSCCCSF